MTYLVKGMICGVWDKVYIYGRNVHKFRKRKVCCLSSVQVGLSC